jgi:dipeptidase D
MAMSKDIEGLVETSTNLASVKMSEPGKIVISTSQRSSVESAKYAVGFSVESAFALAGADVTHSDGYPGWKPKMDSKLLKVTCDTYYQLYGKEPLVKVIHAGLECGLFTEKYPHLELISVGPTMRGVHSPDERLLIPTVDLVWKLIIKTIENL